METVVKKSKSELLKEIAEQRETIENLTKMVCFLTEKVDYLTRQRFAPKSEQLDLNQSSLFELEAPEGVPRWWHLQTSRR